MTQYMGSMFTGISQYLAGKTTRKFALLIIDEQAEERKLSELTVNQVKAIGFAKKNGFKIILVEINPSMNPSKARPTRQSLAMHLPNDITTFYKANFNAFGIIDESGKGKEISHSISSYPDISLLDAELRNLGINELIVMGRQGEQCVKRTVVGGVETSSGIGPNLHGALDYGYQVWTCPKMIAAQKDWLSWYDTKGVKCYTSL